MRPATNTKEVSNLIISMAEIIGKLNAFFTDSVILRMNYTIEGLGSEVESFIGFTSEEVTGHAFSTLCTDHRIVQVIEREITQGYFEGIVTTLLNKKNEPARMRISGFYLGLISDINGYIILKLKPLEDNTYLKNELVMKKRELDAFIYRTAHDLRGPIATIKGLVNLLKIRDGEHEVDELTSLIEIHANKLDDRLFKLLYAADNNHQTGDCTGVVHFPTLKRILEQTLSNNFQVDNSVFQFIATGETQPYINELQLTRLLNNLLLYIVGLPITALPTTGRTLITVEFETHLRKLKVKLHAKGFDVSENIREVISQPISLYNDILNYPFLFNYIVAQREVRQLNGVLSVDFVKRDEQLLRLTIPLNLSLPLTENPDSADPVQ